MKYLIFITAVLLSACGGDNPSPQTDSLPKASTGASHFVGPCQQYVGGACK